MDFIVKHAVWKICVEHLNTCSIEGSTVDAFNKFIELSFHLTRGSSRHSSFISDGVSSTTPRLLALSSQNCAIMTSLEDNPDGE